MTRTVFPAMLASPLDEIPSGSVHTRTFPRGKRESLPSDRWFIGRTNCRTNSFSPVPHLAVNRFNCHIRSCPTDSLDPQQGARESRRRERSQNTCPLLFAGNARRRCQQTPQNANHGAPQGLAPAFRCAGDSAENGRRGFLFPVRRLPTKIPLANRWLAADPLPSTPDTHSNCFARFTRMHR